jgi:hypothetical protein
MRGRPVVDAMLLGLFLLGTTFSIREHFGTRHLETECRRLRELIGDIEVDDPAKVYVKAIRTDQPLEFAWWVYLPNGYRPSYEYILFHGPVCQPPKGPLKNAEQFILRLQIRGDRYGVQSRFHGGEVLQGSMSFTSARASFEGRAVEDPEKLVIRQLGADGKVEFSPDDELLLLEIDPLIREPISMVYRLRFASNKDFIAERMQEMRLDAGQYP